ncbi:MAG: glycoside hydrolase family 3 C-terminal domain-containing protein, partial [Actinopolymorphaceae bacterium]
PVRLSLTHTVTHAEEMPLAFIVFRLGHAEPTRGADVLIDEAVSAAAGAYAAIVVVATTEEVESEGFDRASLALPGRQDELVRRVAAANPRTVVVVNAGSPVEMPWRDEVGAVLLAWFPGQEAGTALADALTGVTEPGGRLPTTWPVDAAGCPVLDVEPTDGVLAYDEGIFIGYRAWLRRGGPAPAYWFGHGLGYTDWSYDSIAIHTGSDDDDLAQVAVSVRNVGVREGREIVQVYLAAEAPEPERPARWLAGFASVTAAPGETVEATVTIPRRAAEVWDGTGWTLVPGAYQVDAGRCVADVRLTAPLALRS